MFKSHVNGCDLINSVLLVGKKIQKEDAHNYYRPHPTGRGGRRHVSTQTGQADASQKEPDPSGRGADPILAAVKLRLVPPGAQAGLQTVTRPTRALTTCFKPQN